jgi:hypothetical protein
MVHKVNNSHHNFENYVDGSSAKEAGDSSGDFEGKTASPDDQPSNHRVPPEGNLENLYTCIFNENLTAPTHPL